MAGGRNDRKLFLTQLASWLVESISCNVCLWVCDDDNDDDYDNNKYNDNNNDNDGDNDNNNNT